MLFDDSNVNSTVDGKRKLGAILGSDGYKHEYFDKLVKDYNRKANPRSTFSICEWL